MTMKSSCAIQQAARAALRKSCAEDPVSLSQFTAPRWASKLKNRPEKFFALAQTPTPIQKWNLSEVPEKFELQVKRDDLAGNLLSGNKIRKLEFILADAVEKGSTCVVTCGGLQSNHCRATTIAAQQVGLGCHLLVRTPSQEMEEVEENRSTSANMLLCKMYGAETYMVPAEPLRSSLPSRLHRLAEELKKQGERPYIIPRGGSDYYGTFGIIKSFVELIQQDVFERFDDIVVSTSSGGTLAGLAVANCLTGERLRIHGVSCSGKQKRIKQKVADILLEYGLVRKRANTVCNVIDGSKWCTEERREENIETVSRVCSETGILLDYTYTLKGLHGMLREMVENGNSFKGNRVLYIHTGGSADIFDGLSQGSTELVEESEGIRMWENIDESPF